WVWKSSCRKSKKRGVNKHGEKETAKRGGSKNRHYRPPFLIGRLCSNGVSAFHQRERGLECHPSGCIRHLVIYHRTSGPSDAAVGWNAVRCLLRMVPIKNAIV